RLGQSRHLIWRVAVGELGVDDDASELRPRSGDGEQLARVLVVALAPYVPLRTRRMPRRTRAAMPASVQPLRLEPVARTICAPRVDEHPDARWHRGCT